METGQNLRVKCKHCSKSFKSKDILATHLTMHDTNAPVKCPVSQLTQNISIPIIIYLLQHINF